MNSLLDQMAPPTDRSALNPGAAPNPLVPSPFQQRIYEEIQISSSPILIQAVAGSGKTSTLVQAIRLATGRSLSLAFNKTIADELRARIASAGECKTFNALGHKLWMSNLPRSLFDMDKMKKILKEVIKDSDDFADHSYSVMRAVGLAKANAVGITHEASFGDLKTILDDYLDVPSDHLDKVAAYSLSAFKKSLDPTSFDFDDQLYGPIYHNWAYPHFDNLFVDEAQDLSPIQHEMLERMGARGARVIAVGDRHQAIYGFRGASHDSMDLLQARFHMIQLPLSISYRCPKLVVGLAQKYCLQIEAKPDAADGTLSYLDQIPDASEPQLYKQGLVLCRTNGPLFRAILRHIRAKEPCRVLSTFLDSFQGFIKSLSKGRRGGAQATLCREVMSRLDAWYMRECEAAEGRRGKLAHLQDKYETAQLLLSEHTTIQEVVDTVRRLANCRTGPIFSTIHKAKGLEDRSVHILRPDLMPSPWASGDEELQQEDNLSYVAITRSLDKLTFGLSERR